jgi:hypothetical protein
VVPLPVCGCCQPVKRDLMPNWQGFGFTGWRRVQGVGGTAHWLQQLLWCCVSASSYGWHMGVRLGTRADLQREVWCHCLRVAAVSQWR